MRRSGKEGISEEERPYLIVLDGPSLGDFFAIDSDELVEYILSRPDVKSNELIVESILDAEMDYLMDKGVAGYVD